MNKTNKEPWRTTLTEHLRSAGFKGYVDTETGVRLKGISMQKFNRARKFHKRVVEFAVDEGKPVPVNVRREYNEQD